ncbi:hypothetical protein ABVK25_000665 [Lepraria finkii]|uniref:MRG domain-containing protein n=1 Tax=Lepraria finkii TaxID=1340010 RepID=A0ABR4BPQ9_9LECA
MRPSGQKHWTRCAQNNPDLVNQTSNWPFLPSAIPYELLDQAEEDAGFPQSGSKPSPKRKPPTKVQKPRSGPPAKLELIGPPVPPSSRKKKKKKKKKPNKKPPPPRRLIAAGIPLEDPTEDLLPHVFAKRRRCLEETFNLRPAVRIHVPDHLKALLVDDWENVTKNLSLVPLPSEHPVNEILNTYFEEEKHKRRLGSAEADLLEEVVAGCKDYFEKCIGRILLYRFERQQYAEVRKLWEEGRGEWEGKNAGDVYGAEHLCRLFVSLPELIAQTNMDSQSVSKLHEEIQKLTSWLGKNSNRFFTAEYETASNDYVEMVRGV